jgi:beta-lactamase regulating signal transducer with metallopeptidase domain
VADSMVTITVSRNIVATAFVFAIGPWIDGIGMKNVFTMLGVLITVILLSVFIFIFYGRKFRVKGAARYRRYASKQFECRVVV